MTAQPNDRRMMTSVQRRFVVSGIGNQTFCLGQNRERSALRGWWRSQWWAGRSFVVDSFEKKQTEVIGIAEIMRPTPINL